MVKYKDLKRIMRLKLDHYLAILAAGAVLFANAISGFAAENLKMDVLELTSGEENVVEDAVQEDSQTEDFEDIYQKQEDFLSKLKNELNMSKTDYRQLLNSIAETKTRLDLVSDEMMTLEQQLNGLDDSINLTTEKLFNVLKQIVEKENEIAILYEQIEVKEVAIEYQKILLSDYIRIIYEEENVYFSFDEAGKIDAFKLLLADGTVGDNLKQLEYFDLLNEAGQQMVEKLDDLSKELKDHKKQLDEKKSKLIELQLSLEDEKEQLEIQKEAKENLLKITQGQEEIYKQLLEQSIAEQESVLNDIKNFSNAVDFIEKKMEEEGADFNPDDYLALLDYKTQVLYDFNLHTEGLEIGQFMWPVDPDRGISAYFHDPGYVGVFGVQHNAIDLPVYQGSTVRAASDGVVYTARDNGYGYSYITLAHVGGFMTVYGHMSEILVEEGQTIYAGSVIGLSGGMPGTKGAGYMTTGPHLHFEVLLNGLYVDPLNYLPLEVLTEDQIEWLPDKYHDAWELAVEAFLFEPVLR
jgi:murein DD-endopeptidase MepM/ murein hydrolase activator NlpD